MTSTTRPTRRTFLAGCLSAGASGLVAPGLVAGQAPAAEAGGQPGDWQIGCFTRPWDQHDYRVALDAIAEAGFKHAGLMTCRRPQGNLVISVNTSPEEARQIGREVSARGMHVPGVYGGGFPVQESLEAGIRGLRRLVDCCAAAGAKTLMVGGTGSQQLYDRYYKAVAECCDYAAEKKVGIVIKPHGGLNATGPQCRKIIQRVGHRNFTLWYDPGNIFYYSDGDLDPADDLADVAGLVTGMCVKDCVFSRQAGRLRKEVMITPGTGRVDFPAVMAGLKRGGFSGGPLVVECLARGGGTLPEILAEARKARAFVEGLVGC